MTKPAYDGFAVVTATTDEARAAACLDSWRDHARYAWPVYVVRNGAAGGYKGVVPAFAEGVQAALDAGAQIIACLHDDLRIDQDDWDQTVIRWFEQAPTCGLAGFGGGTGLGAGNIYQVDYNPMQLARLDFVSNLEDAENHGRRAHIAAKGAGERVMYRAEPVACLDGFSQIGRREFWQGQLIERTARIAEQNLFAEMAAWGVVHHFYDGMLGCFARRLGWAAWMLPIACKHFGGQTAVGDRGYSEWAREQIPGGDQGFWEQAHRIGYERFRDVLPIRVAR